MLTTILFFLLAVMLLRHLRRHYRRRWELDRHLRARLDAAGATSWHQEWERHWAQKFRRQEELRESQTACHLRHRDRDRDGWRGERRAARETERIARRAEREARRAERRGAVAESPPRDEPRPGSRPTSASAQPASGPASAARGVDDGRDAPGSRLAESRDQLILKRARRRAAAEVGFYAHAMTYVSVIGFLALLNLMTAWHQEGHVVLWFVWPAFGWGIGLFAHFMAVFGKRMLQDHYFYPAVEREVRRQTSTVRTEKQASIDELSATIAHEIRNPVAAAKSLVQQMGEDPRSVENVEYAEVALNELDRVERSISHLLRYAKEEALEFAPTNLAGVVDEALKEMRAKLDTANVSVARNYITGPTIVGDAEKLRQVFANILDNAIDAFPTDSAERRIDLFVENGVLERARVRVVDNGPGIPQEKIDRIFNPFFTTKESGTGLGMAISKKIVEAHDGTIDVLSEPGKGAEFVITLPLPN